MAILTAATQILSQLPVFQMVYRKMGWSVIGAVKKLLMSRLKMKVAIIIMV
jgi:hypothetical protein